MPQLDRTFEDLLRQLADKSRRVQVAQNLARVIGVEAILVLLKDDALGIMRPAPGFAQTLPGGSGWRDVLTRAADRGEFKGEVEYPSRSQLQTARVVTDDSGIAIVLVGGTPSVELQDLADAFRLPGALFRAEAAAEIAKSAMQASDNAVRRSTMLASALDLARAQVATNAEALQQALNDAARLNEELSKLNGSLEARVQEEIASRLKVEDALRQAQKMEAIGQLTGGVAHDFNNLLTVIIGGLDRIRRSPPGDTARIERAVEMALQGARRAANLTTRLLAFSRRQALEPKPLDLNVIVRDMTDLLHRTIGEQIELEGVLSPRLWTIEVDQNQLESAIINLAVNARDAMPEGGKLTIETSNATLDESYVVVDAEVIPGQYVAICVSDNGSGMPPEVVARVFEPFFTTKEVGKGTGLGLSMVYGFVKQSRGHVTVYSEVGQGTTIRMYFPRFVGAHVRAESAAAVGNPLANGDEIVLLVEDNDDVRAYSHMILTELGYQVIEAADADAALDVVRSDQRIDLLFTDVVLPGKSGRALVDLALQLRPELKVLFTTGYSRNAIVHHGRLDPGVSLISKPFTYEELAVRVREVLDSK